MQIPNDNYKKLIKKTATELGIEESIVSAAVRNLIDWQVTSIINEEYVSYLWERFGVWEFFNRKNNKVYRKEVQIYRNNKRRKDRVKSVDLEETEEEIKEKEELITEIIKFHPCDRPNKFTRYAYIMTGLYEEYQWNINKMKNDTLDNVRKCLKLMQNNVTKDSTYESKNQEAE